MTVVQLLDDNGDHIDQLKIYNNEEEVKKDPDFKRTAATIGDFLQRLVNYIKTRDIVFEGNTIDITKK